MVNAEKESQSKIQITAPEELLVRIKMAALDVESALTVSNNRNYNVIITSKLKMSKSSI